MNNFGWHIRSLILRFFEFLLKLYPPRFRHEFSSEIQEIVLSRVRGAEKLGRTTWLSAVFQEIMGLIPSIIRECWHELRFQKERAVATGSQLQKVSFVKTIAYIRWADPPLWMVTLANLLPLWFLSFIFLPHPVSWKLGGIAFVLYIVVFMILLWIRWFTPELILYSFFPIIPIWIFDEMPASYEIAFELICTFLLSIGIFGYRLSLHKDSVGLAWLILLVVFIGTWILASQAVQNYSSWVYFFSP